MGLREATAELHSKAEKMEFNQRSQFTIIKNGVVEFDKLSNDPRMEIVEINNQIMHKSGQIFKCVDKIAELNAQIKDDMTEEELRNICKKINKVSEISQSLEKEINKLRAKSEDLEQKLNIV